MARTQRIKSRTGIYHIMMRGINRQTIFEDQQDYKKFIGTLQKYQEICQYELYAYCLMGNHVHILLKEGQEPLEQVMRRICGSYVYWYNQKYERVGNLFQDRFSSEPVENDTYLLTVLRYIFQNPFKAGIVKETGKYKWHNYRDYIYDFAFVNPTVVFVLGMFHADKKEAVNRFIEFISNPNEDILMDVKDIHRVTDADAEAIISKICGLPHAIDLQGLDKQKRDEYLKKLKKSNVSARQIERLTGISRRIISRV